MSTIELRTEITKTPKELLDGCLLQGLGVAEIRQKLVDSLGISHATAANEHLTPYQQQIAVLGALGTVGALQGHEK